MLTVYPRNLNMFFQLRTCDPSQAFPTDEWAKVLQDYFRATLDINQIIKEASLYFIDCGLNETAIQDKNFENFVLYQCLV